MSTCQRSTHCTLHGSAWGDSTWHNVAGCQSVLTSRLCGITHKYSLLFSTICCHCRHPFCIRICSVWVYLCTAASTRALSSLQTAAVRNPIRCEPQRDSELIYLFNMNLSNMFLWKLWEVLFSNPLWDAPRCGPRCVHEINSSNSRNTVAASLSRSLWTTKAEEKSKSSELRTDHRR